jgi:hypothetical protein
VFPGPDVPPTGSPNSSSADFGLLGAGGCRSKAPIEREGARITQALVQLNRDLEALAPLSLNAGAAVFLIRLYDEGAGCDHLAVLSSMLPHLTGTAPSDAARGSRQAPADDDEQDDEAAAGKAVQS